MFSFRKLSNKRYSPEPFAPVKKEQTFEDLEVVGQIPEELEGTYIRNGPNPVTETGWRHHYFSGDGMIHGIKISRGKALWYRNRFINVGKVPKALGLSDPGGPISSSLDISPNTNIVRFGKKLYASIEAGPSLVEISEELETIKRSNLDGQLKNGFTGHHKIDPEDKDIHGVIYSSAIGNNAYYVRLNEDGILLNEIKVPLASSTQIHDMSITKNYAVIYDLNIDFKLWMLWKTTLPIKWNAQKQSRLGVVPKNGSDKDVIWFKVNPCYVYHPMNAYEEDKKLIIDVSRYETASKKDHYGPLGDSTPQIFRWTLDLNRPQEVQEEVLFDLNLDFPKLNPQFEGRKYKYGYGVEASLKPSFDAIVKMDIDSRTYKRNTLDGGMASEMTFIPKSHPTSEDDGWLMGFVYQPKKRRSRLVIMDAKEFESEPRASIWIPDQYVPIGTHGNWFPTMDDKTTF